MTYFLRVQYRLGNVTEQQLDNLVLSGKITDEDKIYILS